MRPAKKARENSPDDFQICKLASSRAQLHQPVSLFHTRQTQRKNQNHAKIVARKKVGQSANRANCGKIGSARRSNRPARGNNFRRSWRWNKEGFFCVYRGRMRVFGKRVECSRWGGGCFMMWRRCRGNVGEVAQRPYRAFRQLFEIGQNFFLVGDRFWSFENWIFGIFGELRNFGVYERMSIGACAFSTSM